MCTKPLIRAETYETYINKKGGKSYKTEFLQSDFADYELLKEIQKKMKHRYRKMDMIPCGQCWECKLNYSRQWATDCMLEKRYYPENECWFITLTYKDEFLPIGKTEMIDEQGQKHEFYGISLRKKDLQNFWKRVRKIYHKKKIIYLNVGEYGKTTRRPHYHAIVFGLPLDESKFKKIGNNMQGDALWTSPELEELWSTKINGKKLSIGQVQIGRVTWRSCAYVARYCLKKIGKKTDKWYLAQGKLPEFVSMSQGIARRYYEENKETIEKTDSVPITNAKGNQCIAPKRFMKLLKESDPELHDQIKRKRQSSVDYQTIIDNTKNNLTPSQRRKQAEERMNQVLKDLRGDF